MVQLEIQHLDNVMTFYPINPGQGWKIDAAMRCIIVGRGLGRYIIPMDNIRAIQVTGLSDTDPASSDTVVPDSDDILRDW